MGSKRGLMKFIKRGRHNDGELKELRKKEKILQKQKTIEKYMVDCIFCEEEVEEVISLMPRTASVLLDALHWFRVLRATLHMKWRQLLHDEDADMSDASAYLIRINEDGLIFKSLTRMSKYYVREWLKRANFATIEIYLYRYKMLSLSQKLKNFFLGGRKLPPA